MRPRTPDGGGGARVRGHAGAAAGEPAGVGEASRDLKRGAGSGLEPAAKPGKRPAVSSGTASETVSISEQAGAGGVAPEEVWPRVKAAAGPRIRGMLDVMSVRSVTPRLLTLAVPTTRAAMARDHLDEITRLVQGTGVRGMSISLVEVQPEAAAERDAPAGNPAGDQTGRGVGEQDHAAAERGLQDAERHPLVREAARVFGAKVVHVEPKRGGAAP